MSQSATRAVAPVLNVVNGRATTTSLDVALHFGKRHDNIIRDIESLRSKLPAHCLLNFEKTAIERPSPLTGAPIKSPAYRLTRDGFTLLAMGFTGKKALDFKLAYIDAFKRMEAQLRGHPPLRPVVQLRAPKPPRRIQSREDLSFTKRNAQGNLLNWCVASRDGQWHEHYGIGEIWFREIVELAQCNPEEAFNAMRFGGKELLQHWGRGHESGFMEALARWALTGMLDRRGIEPRLPFKTLKMGTPPAEGFEFFLNQEDRKPTGSSLRPDQQAALLAVAQAMASLNA
jgi:Rha family phage regulatory protein